MAPEALMLDLVDWLDRAPRPYAEAIETWRTSCPRLTVWEDAMDKGWVEARRGPAGGLFVVATRLGLERLRERHH